MIAKCEYKLLFVTFVTQLHFIFSFIPELALQWQHVTQLGVPNVCRKCKLQKYFFLIVNVPFYDENKLLQL